MRKHVISGLLALLFLLALPLPAAAQPVPDESRNGHCSITVSMTYKGKAVRGGTLALYKVGDVAEDGGNYSFVPVEEIQADIPEFGDIESPDLAGKLCKLESKLTPVTDLPKKGGGRRQRDLFRPDLRPVSGGAENRRFRLRENRSLPGERALPLC